MGTCELRLTYSCAYGYEWLTKSMARAKEY
jgi:hypothetical protein